VYLPVFIVLRLIAGLVDHLGLHQVLSQEAPVRHVCDLFTHKSDTETPTIRVITGGRELYLLETFWRWEFESGIR
jgi:hypothetical protein